MSGGIGVRRDIFLLEIPVSGTRATRETRLFSPPLDQSQNVIISADYKTVPQ
jgi:hypothetical protein